MPHYILSGHLVVEVTRKDEKDDEASTSSHDDTNQEASPDRSVITIVKETVEASSFGLEESSHNNGHVQEMYKAFCDGYTITLEIGSYEDGFSIELTGAEKAIISDQSFFSIQNPKHLPHDLD